MFPSSFLDQVSAVALLMVKVVQHAQVWIANPAYNLERLAHLGYRFLLRLQVVHRLQQHVDVLSLANVRGHLQGIGNGLHLCLAALPRHTRPTAKTELRAANVARDRDGFCHLIRELGVRRSVGQRSSAGKHDVKGEVQRILLRHDAAELLRRPAHPLTHQLTRGVPRSSDRLQPLLHRHLPAQHPKHHRKPRPNPGGSPALRTLNHTHP